MRNQITVDNARKMLPDAQRILVIGVSGGGKSTLSTRLSNALGLTYVSLDRDVRWLPGWQVRDKAEQRVLVAKFVAQDRWVIDGTSVGSFDLRLPRADLVVWVRVPRRVALWGLARRIAANWGRVRDGMAPGCPEPLPDAEFLGYIWHFERRQAPRNINGINAVRPDVPVCVLRNRRDMARLVRGL